MREDDHSGLDGLCAGYSSIRSGAMGGKKRKSSNEHAVGGKKQKSSNQRDSWLYGITPSSHVAAASTAPSSRTAAVSAANNAELMDDNDVDFGRGDYDDDYGDWDR